jgi:acyl-CoA reductase-like NAD-dependent aldehyde dehydrogenase
MSATLLIDGSWQSGKDGAVMQVINPAYGTPFAEIAVATPEDVDAAVQSARAAFPAWSQTTGRERASLMHAAMRIFREKYLDEAARLLTQENGKPLNDSLKEVRYSADVIDFYADESRRITGTHFAGDMGSTHSYVLRQPIGVVGAIVPSNFPVDLLAWKLGPGLAAGCTFVVKPPEEAPLAILRFIQAFVDAGLPAGVINVVTGDASAGRALVEHPDVPKIAFTGSTAVGRWIAERAGRQLKRLTLELGGSAPFIVCRDADVPRAVAESLRRCFSHTGQICISVNRIFVHEQIAGDFLDLFVEKARALRVAADGLLEPAADMGAMLNPRAVEKAHEHVLDAQRRGAQLLVGGAVPADAGYAPGGYFYMPAVLSHVTPDMLVMQEETFGPVAPIASFRTLDQAIEMANSTPYGLAAYLYTRDLDIAHYASKRLNFGGIGINVNDVTDIRAPFGGTKHSGIGRELGQVGMDAYFETKHIRYAFREPNV